MAHPRVPHAAPASLPASPSGAARGRTWRRVGRGARAVVVAACLVAVACVATDARGAVPPAATPARGSDAAASARGVFPSAGPPVMPLLADTAPPSTPAATPARLVPAAWARPPAPRTGSAAPPQIAAAAAVVLDEASGAVLYAQAPHRRLAPASLTKMATAIVAVQRGDLDAIAVVGVDSRRMRGSSVMGLVPGDEFTMRDLLYGLLLPSGNDAALALARAVAGADAAFVDDMNALVARLGLVDTHFANAHGLGGGPAHYSSAYDLALLARTLMDTPPLPDIVATRTWTALGSREIRMRTLNSLLLTYPGADGVKTGYTRSAGRTLAASATRDGHRVYVVLLHDAQREADATRLLDWTFANFDWSVSAPGVAVPRDEVSS